MRVPTPAASLALFLRVSAGTFAQATYDVVLSGGRVMDPESGVDGVLDVGISDGVVRAMSTTPLQGRQRIDASAMVVAPGFMDLHQHAHTPAVYVRRAIVDPLVVIASDGLLLNGVGHPRTAGTFARILGKYVREERALTLMEALRKMTVAPARVLGTRVPGMRNKGRIKVGADADIVVFNPETVGDRSTYRQPTLPPAGIAYVFVGGVAVVSNGAPVPAATPGRAIRAAR